MTYDLHSRDYLHRARQCLDEGRADFLFYAAFELRCGIEVRMQQYLDAQSHISKQMKKGWKIAQLARNLDKAFKSGDKIVEFAIHDRETETHVHTLYYTPVSSKLKKMGERLGNYLHSMKEYHSPDEQWWNDLRDFLEGCYLELRIANIGTLLGVPLLHPRTKTVTMSAEPSEGETVEDLTKMIGNIGDEIAVKVQYLDELPKKILST